MNLLFVVPCYYPATRYGGPIKSIHDLARELVHQGERVTVFTTNANGGDDLDVPRGSAVPIDGVNVMYFPVRWPRRYFRSPVLASALRETIAGFDLVYAAWMYVHSTAAAARESRRSNVPLVISPRGMLDTASIMQRGRVKKLAYISLVGRKAIRHARAVHFTSPGEMENSYQALGADKALVIPNGVQVTAPPPAVSRAVDLAPLGIDVARPIVLFLGRISYIKGLDLLAAAWPEVLKKVPSAQLVMAGADDEGLYPSLRRQFEASGTGTSVRYVGVAGPELKAALLQHCAVLANPSYLESFGMAIVEAMAEGKPVVVTDRVNIARDIEREGAGLVTQCDAPQVAEAIEALLLDSRRAAQMGARGRGLVETSFSLPSVAGRIRSAFASIVVESKATRSDPS